MISTISKSQTASCIKRTDLPLTFRNWRPAHHELLTVELTPTNERIIEITDHLDALFINGCNGEELYRYSLELGSSILYAVASDLHTNKYFVVRASDYACSCWQYRTGHKCKHSDAVKVYVEGVQYAA